MRSRGNWGRRRRRIRRTHGNWHRRRRSSGHRGLGWNGRCRLLGRRRNPGLRNGCGSGCRSQRGWTRGRGWTRRSSCAHRSLLLSNGIENVARPGNIGEIDLGFNFIAVRAARARVLSRGLSLTGPAQVGANLLRLVLFNGTGVRLFLRDAYDWKCVENRLAFDFQLPGQIVNSNLAHPPFLSSGLSR